MNNENSTQGIPCNDGRIEHIPIPAPSDSQSQSPPAYTPSTQSSLPLNNQGPPVNAYPIQVPSVQTKNPNSFQHVPPTGYQTSPPAGYQTSPPAGYQTSPPGYQTVPPNGYAPIGYQTTPNGYQQAPAGYQTMPPPAGYQVIQTYPVPPTWPTHSVRVTCPSCRNQCNTLTDYKLGAFSWLSCGVLCFLTGCGPIALLIDGFKDVEHRCPQCSTFLGVSRRI